eukprot:gene3762-4284_t
MTAMFKGHSPLQKDEWLYRNDNDVEMLGSGSPILMGLPRCFSSFSFDYTTMVAQEKECCL